MYEYMACGKSIISTRLPGVVKEFGEHSGVVYVEKPENAIEKTVELIRNGELRELEIKTRSLIERCSWDHVADESERILEDSGRARFTIDSHETKETSVIDRVPAG